MSYGTNPWYVSGMSHGRHVSDLEILGEQSGTVDSTHVVSGGTEVSTKKAKIILTEEEERVYTTLSFAKQSQLP